MGAGGNAAGTPGVSIGTSLEALLSAPMEREAKDTVVAEAAEMDVDVGAADGIQADVKSDVAGNAAEPHGASGPTSGDSDLTVQGRESGGSWTVFKVDRGGVYFDTPGYTLTSAIGVKTTKGRKVLRSGMICTNAKGEQKGLAAFQYHNSSGAKAYMDVFWAPYVDGHRSMPVEIDRVTLKLTDAQALVTDDTKMDTECIVLLDSCREQAQTNRKLSAFLQPPPEPAPATRAKLDRRCKSQRPTATAVAAATTTKAKKKTTPSKRPAGKRKASTGKRSRLTKKKETSRQASPEPPQCQGCLVLQQEVAALKAKLAYQVELAKKHEQIASLQATLNLTTKMASESTKKADSSQAAMTNIASELAHGMIAVACGGNTGNTSSAQAAETTRTR